MISIKIGTLRRIIREALMVEAGEATGASGVDPTKDPKIPQGDRPDRGTDIHGFWYRSPGRTPGADGDPKRPPDAAEYIGQKPKEIPPAGPAQDALEYIGMKPKSAEAPASEEGAEGTEGDAGAPGEAPVPGEEGQENPEEKSEPGRR